MYKVFKYTLTGEFTKLSIPGDHTFLRAEMQDAALRVWAAVNTESVEIDVTLAVVPTGGNVRAGWEHISTFFDGSLVFHVFVLPLVGVGSADGS